MSGRLLSLLIIIGFMGIASHVFAADERRSREVIRVTDTPFLRESFQQLIELSHDPILCDLIVATEQPFPVVGLQRPRRVCKPKPQAGPLSPAPLSPQRVELFPGRNGLHEFYLVFESEPLAKGHRSWTDAKMNTFIFVGRHTSRDDLLRSLVHELSLVYDLKYDATLWDFYFGLPHPLTPWFREFFKMWMESPVVRIGLAVARAERTEALVFGDERPRSTCYASLRASLIKQNEFGTQYLEVGDRHDSTSFHSQLAVTLEKESLVKTSKAVADRDLEEWLARLAVQDPDQSLCRFLVTPIVGASPNFVAAGPRPGMGDGLRTSPSEPESAARRQLQDAVRKSLRELQPVVEGSPLLRELDQIEGSGDGRN